MSTDSTITRLVQRNFADSGEKISRTIERLSSGLRINSTSEDPAGTILSDNLASKSKVLRQGVKNLNDGASVINLASNALESLSDIVTKQQEYAEQAATELTSTAQREALDSEANALVAEYNRILETVSFNGLYVSDGVFPSFNVRAGDSNIILEGANLFVEGQSAGPDGTFQASTSVATNATVVEAVDLNGDGALDLFSSNLGGNVLNISLNNGDGTFQSTLTLAGGSSPRAISTGDFNGDGFVDLISADSSYYSLFLGNGDGTYQTIRTVPTSALTYDVTTADVNGDGKTDIIGADATTNHINIYFGNGDGTFQSVFSLSTGTSPRSVIATDIDNNGTIDLVSADRTSNRLSVYGGNGDGTFQAVYTLTTGALPNAVVSGDLNGDGKTDLISAQFTENTLNIFLGNGDGTFQAPSTLATGLAPRDVIAVDFDADGVLDLVSADANSDNLSIFFGNGNGTFQSAVSISSGSVAESVDSGDIDGDGVLDLISTGGGIRIYLQNTVAAQVSGSFQTALDLTTQDGAEAAVTYLSGIADVITAAKGVTIAGTSRLDIALNNLNSTADALDLAVGRITDAEVATEYTKFTTAQVKQQSALYLLAQANLDPVTVTRLLDEDS